MYIEELKRVLIEAHVKYNLNKDQCAELFIDITDAIRYRIYNLEGELWRKLIIEDAREILFN